MKPRKALTVSSYKQRTINFLNDQEILVLLERSTTIFSQYWTFFVWLFTIYLPINIYFCGVLVLVAYGTTVFTFPLI